MRLIVLTVTAGVLLGVAGWASDSGPALVDWAGAIAAGWLLSAFVVGALAGTPLRAALAGAATIVVGVATYYALFHPVRGSLVGVAAAWSTFGLGIGAVLGWAGDAWRRSAARLVLAAELALGATLPYLLARSKLAATIALTAAVAVAVVAGEQAVRETMRVAGWSGA